MTKPVKTIAAGWSEMIAALPDRDLAPVTAKEAIDLARTAYYSGATHVCRMLAETVGEAELEGQAAHLAAALSKEASDTSRERFEAIMREQTLVPPTVNLNGASKAALMTGYTAMLAALRLANELLGKHAPHGRDYPDGDYKVASDQHRVWRQAIADVHDDIEKIATAVRARG